MPGTGKYLIQSLIEEEPIVGIAPPLPPSAGLGPVILSEAIHINGEGIVWQSLLPMQNARLISSTVVESYAAGRYKDLPVLHLWIRIHWGIKQESRHRYQYCRGQ